jgi:hypothetical protein
MNSRAVTRRVGLHTTLATTIFLLGELCAMATNYYVDSAGGSDSFSGLSTASPWRSISRANGQTYRAGDNILLKRGCSWQGEGFKAKGSGTPGSPITLDAYGTGLPPVIDAVGAHEAAVLLLNVQNWTVRNLRLTQHDQTPQNLDANNEKGKDADQYSDEYMRAVVHVLGLGPAGVQNCGEGCTVRNILLEKLIVENGQWNGIYVSGGYYQFDSGRFGFVDNITVSSLETCWNHKAGIEITCTYYKTRSYATTDVEVSNCAAHDNGGDGIMVGPVKGGVLEFNKCFKNGRIRNARLGCWTWDSENTIIQFNESYQNMTPLANNKARDGGGFDLDLGTENGMMQYNYSHDNQGEGYLLDSWPVGFGYDRGVSHNVQMRYNVSESDGKKLSGGITVFGGVSGAIYNNTVFYEADRLPGSVMFQGEGAPLTTSVWGKSGKPNLKIYNNIFITKLARSGAVANNIWSDGVGIFTVNNNIWWRFEGGLRFQFGTKPITSWTGWRALGFDSAGMNADPKVVGPLGSDSLAYKLLSVSPARNKGRGVLDTLQGMGPQDAAGVSIPKEGAYDIGAFEFVP